MRVSIDRFGIDHERFTKKFQGLDYRLTGVEPSKVVKGILAQGIQPDIPASSLT